MESIKWLNIFTMQCNALWNITELNEKITQTEHRFYVNKWSDEFSFVFLSLSEQRKGKILRPSLRSETKFGEANDNCQRSQ